VYNKRYVIGLLFFFLVFFSLKKEPGKLNSSTGETQYNYKYSLFFFRLHKFVMCMEFEGHEVQTSCSNADCNLTFLYSNLEKMVYVPLKCLFLVQAKLNLVLLWLVGFL